MGEISEGNPTSFPGNMLTMQQTLRQYGVDADALLAQVGIDPSDYIGTSKRVPAEAMNEFMKLSVEAVGEPTYSLRCVDNLSPASYHALGSALLYSSNLREFCQRFSRFFSLISTMDKVDYEQTDDYACLKMWPVVNVHELTRNFDSDAFSAVVLKFIRLMYRPDYSPLKVSLIWTPSDEFKEQYLQYFGCEMEFSAEVTAFYIEQKDLDIPLAASNVELARQNDKVVVEFLERMGKVDLPSRVYAKIIEMLPSGECSRNKVAESLHMSASAFHDKLTKAGTSYQELLDKTRNSLAESYMHREELSISEIAYLLGFTDSSNFSRAFKRWTGVSPREYRKNLKS